MQFIETTDGYIARERVLRVIPSEYESEYDHVEYVAADGRVRTTRLDSPIGAALGSTIVPALDGYRVIRIQLPDATAPAITTVVPVLAWRVSNATGDAEAVTAHVDFDTRGPDCAIESNSAPGVVSRGVVYQTLFLFIEARRDAIREAVARRAAETAAENERRAARATRVEKPVCLSSPVFGCDEPECANAGECLGVRASAESRVGVSS